MMLRRSGMVARVLAIALALGTTGAVLSSGSASAGIEARQAAATSATSADLQPADAPPGDGIVAGYWVDSVTRIAKLGSNLTVPRGRFDALVKSTGTLRGNLTLPAAKGYFVTFGIMPVTSTVELIPDGEATGTVKIVPGEHGLAADADVTAKILIALKDVRVDGVPLDAGPGCRTRIPASIRIKGVLGLTPEAPPTEVVSTFDMPSFSGCGVREDLDRVLSGLVSGPGNELRTTLSIRCITREVCEAG
ncbi:hypothetical protein SAMN05216266_1482 [Amycolatopsis marina]|uniref:Secreted protein n=1 Tax=Amycolatopsis marina TaxID=490629 RepID=A0A1I1CW46_9PSEU|nr:hypothetical protein [Amycolatopsis marina]SFB64800.1 hypothetical protein SAMN05216266_1482 [Amycolatopsis marina]